MSPALKRRDSRSAGIRAAHSEPVPCSPKTEIKTELNQELVPFGLRGRIPALDGLRGIAILLVLLWHGVFGAGSSNLLAVGKLSWSGVDLFFVLSGFLIGGILLDARESTAFFKTFYIRRAFRILPLYGLIIGLYGLYRLRYLFPASGGFPAGVGIPLASYLTFTQNFWMAYLGAWGSTIVMATWSLAVEEQFYLTIPILVRKLQRSRLTLVLILVVIGAPLLRIGMLFKLPHGNLADYLLMPCRADALCLGALSAILVRNRRGWDFLLARRTSIYLMTGGLLLVLAWFSYKQYGQTSTPMVTFGFSVLALFYTCCLLIALMKTRISERLLCNRHLMELGGIAYCVYLVHTPLIVAGRRVIPMCFPFLRKLSIPHVLGIELLLGGLVGIVVSVAIAKVSWRFFEHPLLRRGHAYKF
jgi:peptidoglycan/LPS O-acetylase OafA/YrhL